MAPLVPHRKTPMQRVRDAALAYAEAESEAEYTRAEKRLRKAAWTLARAMLRAPDSTRGATLAACESSSSSE